MTDLALRIRGRARLTSLALALAFIFGSGYALVAGQTPAKKALTVDDYTRWRSISGAEISGDGKWVTYGLSLTNTPQTESKPVLHLVNLETNQDVEVPRLDCAVRRRRTVKSDERLDDLRQGHAASFRRVLERLAAPAAVVQPESLEHGSRLAILADELTE